MRLKNRDFRRSERRSSLLRMAHDSEPASSWSASARAHMRHGCSVAVAMNAGHNRSTMAYPDTGEPALRPLFRIARAAALLAITLTLAVLGLLAHPQPLFAHSVADGRLELWSDRPFDAEAGRRVLADIESRISRSPLDRRDGAHRIFVVNEPWRARLLFLWSYGVGGVNYYPLTRNVFIRRSDIAAIQFHRLPAWVREGLADYIALPDEHDLETLQAKLAAGDRALDPKKSGLYARYRLMVTLALEKQGWTLDRLLNAPPSRAEAEQLLFRTFPPAGQNAPAEHLDM
jgi:hypothetical protein